MTSPGDYSFRLKRTSYKSCDLLYSEPGHTLVVYLEMSGLKEFDWVGIDSAFRQWTEPAGESIPSEKAVEILQRFQEWARTERIRVHFGPPIDLEKFFADQERAGHRVERRPDGSVAVYPKTIGFLERVSGLLRVCARVLGL